MASDPRPIEGAPLEGRELLGALLGQRRAELGYTHRPAFAGERLPLTPSGNPNTRLLADIEEAYRDNFPESRLRQLAQAYLVTYESLTAVAHLRARALVPLAAAPLAVPLPAGAGDPPMADPDRQGADQPYALVIFERLALLSSEGVTDPPGGRVFPGDPDSARVWDDMRRWPGLDIRDRAWLLADVQRRAAARTGNHGASADRALPPRGVSAHIRVNRDLPSGDAPVNAVHVRRIHVNRLRCSRPVTYDKHRDCHMYPGRFPSTPPEGLAEGAER